MIVYYSDEKKKSISDELRTSLNVSQTVTTNQTRLFYFGYKYKIPDFIWIWIILLRCCFSYFAFNYQAVFSEFYLLLV